MSSELIKVPPFTLELHAELQTKTDALRAAMPRVATRTAPGQQPAASRLPTTLRTADEAMRCVHRGDSAGEKLCPTCNGSVRIKLFTCAVHVECSIQKSVGVAVCATCPDYQPKRS